MPERQSWKSIRDRIHGRILARDYKPGDKLPRDADLAQELGCARSTVQRAMQDLTDAGIVERKRKGGTHVRPDPVTRATLDIPVTRREVEARGAVYGYQLIERAVAPAPRRVIASLELPTVEDLLHVSALHLADQRPYVLEDRWISLTTCPEVAHVDLARESANEWLVMNKPYSRCDVRMYAVEADAAMSAALEARVGAALLVIERSTWIGSSPITTVRSVTQPGYQLITQG